MRFPSKAIGALGILAAVVLTASAADARVRHPVRAYDSYGPLQYDYGYGSDAPRGRRPYGATSEEYYGTSVPYDPDGPGWNDFQLQGKD